MANYTGCAIWARALREIPVSLFIDLVQQQVVRGFVKDWEYGATFNQFDGRFLVSMSHVGMALCQPGDQSGPIVNEDYAGNVCTAGELQYSILSWKTADSRFMQ